MTPLNVNTKQDVDLDLDLENYSLEDILDLFKLTYDFTEDDLKSAKKIASLTHPDHSGLNAEIFMFFTKAYKYLDFIFNHRQRNNRTIRENLDAPKSHDIIIDKIKEKKDFHNIFNSLFEEHKLKNEFSDNGYKDWLSSDEDMSECKTSNEGINDMKIAFHNEKKKKIELTVYTGVHEINNTNLSDLSGKAPDNHSSKMFSNLSYEDVKIAHTENFIPISDEHYDPSKQFNSVSQLQQFRASECTSPLSRKQAQKYFENINKVEATSCTQRAFRLAKQMEEANERKKQIFSKFKYLQ